MPDKQTVRTGLAALMGLSTGASGVIAVITLPIAAVCAWYGYPLGVDAQAMVIGDVGDLYTWIFKLLLSAVLMLVAIVGGGVGLLALTFAGFSVLGLVAATKGK